MAGLDGFARGMAWMGSAFVAVAFLSIAAGGQDAAGLATVMDILEKGGLAVFAVVAVVSLVQYSHAAGNRMFAVQPNPGLGFVRLALALGIAWILLVMGLFADENVWTPGFSFGFYFWLYVCLAVASLFAMSFWRPILSLDYRGDVVERGNLAAGLVLAGFVLGTAFAFGGALTGEDASCRPPLDARAICQGFRELSPGETWGYGGWWVVMVFFLLAYVELRTSLKVVHRLGKDLEDGVRLDRDPSAGVLLFGVAVSCGLVAGRAAAGDFTGWADALQDYFRRLWPMLLIPPVAILAGRLSAHKPNPMRARAATAALLVSGAAAYYVLT